MTDPTPTDLENALENPDFNQVSIFLDFTWKVIIRNDKVTGDYYNGKIVRQLFTTYGALDRYYEYAPDARDYEVREMKGTELFTHLDTLSEFDGVYIDAYRNIDWPPFSLCDIHELASGREPRATAKILRARSIEEIHDFLSERGMFEQSRQHQMEYCGDDLVASYTGPIADVLNPRDLTFRFYPTDRASSPLEYGPGATEILCAGKLADVLRRQYEMFDRLEPNLVDWATTVVRRANEIEKIFPDGVNVLPRETMRSIDGARFVREYPHIATREFVEETRELFLDYIESAKT